MAFQLIKDPRGDTPTETVRIASQAYTIGDLVMLDRTSDAIDVVPATASSICTNIYGVAYQTVTSSATSLLIQLVREDQTWQVDSTNNSNSNHRMLRAVLTDKATINNTGTDVTGNTGVFLQTGEIGSAGNKKLLGKLLRSPGVT